MIQVRKGLVTIAHLGVKLEIDLSLDRGDFVLLTGRNGSGKSTALDVLSGARGLDQGEILGLDPREPVGYAVQDSHSGLLPWLRVIDNILLPARIAGRFVGVRERAMACLDRFALADRATDFPYRLSGGEKKVVNLVRALFTPASLFLLDEVLDSLHADNQAVAKGLILEAIAGKICLMVSHEALDLPFNRRLALVDGRIVEEPPVRAERGSCHAG